MRHLQRRFILPSLVLVASLFAFGTSRASSSIGWLEAIDSEPVPAEGSEYYARHTFMYEKGEHKATNYWRGALVPINTRLRLVKLREKDMTLQVVDSGQTIKVVNVPEFTMKSMSAIARNMLALEPVPLDQFEPNMAANIKSGLLRLGMTKEQVLMTRGFPPAHKTPVLDGDQWTYWSSRFAIHTLVFTNGVLTEGRGIN